MLPADGLVGWHDVSEDASADLHKNMLLALRYPGCLAIGVVLERKFAVQWLAQSVRANYLLKQDADLKTTATVS